MNKRIVSLGLVASMLVGLTACSQSGQTTSGSAGGAAATKLQYEDKANQYGWNKPKTTLTMSVYGGQGDQAAFEKDKDGGKRYYDKWLLDNMNVKFDWHMYANDMDEKLNMMLASGDYPEIITGMSDDMANKFASQNKALDLTDLVDKYAPNYTRRMGQYYNMLKNKDGKVFKLDSYYGENPNVAGWDFGMRYDYWKELGEKSVYTTLDGYFDALQKALKNHPTNKNGQKTYAFTSTDKGVNFLSDLLASYGFIGNFKVENGKFTHWLNTPEGLEAAKFMNKCYRAGMIDPDYLNTNYDQMIAKLNTEQVIGNMNAWWYAWYGGHEYWASQEGSKYNMDKRFMNVSVAANGDLSKTTLLTQKFVSTYRMILTDKCKEPADVMKYINWENSELGNIIVGWAPPSEDNFWNIAADGTWKIRDDCLDPNKKADTFQKRATQHGGGIYRLCADGNWLHTTDSATTGKANFDKLDKRVGHVSIFDFWTMNADNKTFKDPGVNICWGNYKAPMQDTTLYAVTYDPTDDITVTKQNITDAIQAGWASMISAKDEAACTAAFNATKEKCTKMGLDKLTQYNQKAYEDNVKKFEQKK